MPENSSDESSHRARLVLVPVSNPNTAPGLLNLAWSLADPEEGRVIALYVTLGDTEDDDDAIEEMTAIVEQERAEGAEVELMTRTAPTVARGILDVARDEGVSLIVIGFQSAGQGKVVVGPVVESVARTTPCDLIVFRSAKQRRLDLEDVKRVLMPLNGSDNAHVAARVGLQLADAYDAEPIAMYVETDPHLPDWHGMARIEASLSRAPQDDARRVRRRVIKARDVVQGIVSRSEQDDVLVIGFSERSSLDLWIFGNIVQRLLVQSPGPVIVVKQAIGQDVSDVERIGRRLLAQFSPRLTPAERTEVQRHASELSVRGINFYVLMFLSSLLASLGLLQNSVAVIIGAMLVAPLMSPLMAFSVGLLQGRLRLMRDAALTTITGVGIGLAVAVGLGLLFPVEVPTEQMLVRGEPSLLDLGIALASGAVGAYAMGRKDIPAALAGVAIAAALVPPLCTIGLAIAFGAQDLALGSGLLFATNIVSISLAGAGVFLWLGIRPERQAETMMNWIVSVIVLAVLAVPLASAFLEVVRLEQQTNTVHNVLSEHFSPGEVVDLKLTTTGDPFEVHATIRSVEWLTPVDVQEAQAALSDALGEDVALELTNVRAIEP
ncbi:MAG: DUF389 domain-containing protein [Chloroflexi bacterium]|nr:DUF389 domain-containing protein [Chloroflexota bacterium]